MSIEQDRAFPPLPELAKDCVLGAGRRLRPRKSSEIAASRISIGCECLDRQMWHANKAYSHLAETGAKWARVQTGWSRCEREPGKFEFTWLDEIVDAMIGLGVQPWFNVTYGNILYTGAPTPEAVGWTPVYSPTAAMAWRRFVGELTLHFRDRISRYEVWNEPDLACFWRQEPQPNPLKYAELVAITAMEIRRHQPEAFIIGGATCYGTDPNGLEYLETALRAGMGRNINAFSYHVYRPRPESNRPEELRALRAMLARHGLAIEVWQGEAGCPSEPSTTEAMHGIPWNEAKQAKWLLRRMILDLAQEVDLTTYFHLSDFHNYFYDGPVNMPAFFGLLRNNSYTRKPSYGAFQSVCSLFDSQTRVDRELHASIFVDETSHAGAASKDWLLTQVAPFARRDLPMLAYWYPADLNPELNQQAPFAPGRIRINLSHPLGLKIHQPMLVDPVTQQAYALTGKLEKFPYHSQPFLNNANPAGRLVFNNLPLLDYPLLIVDIQALEFAD